MSGILTRLSRRSARRSASIAAVALAVLVTTGAEEAGCAPPADDKVTTTGDRGGKACLHTISAPYVNRGRVRGEAIATCFEAVLRHNFTVTLEKKGPSGWSEIARVTNDKAPGKGSPKRVEVAAGCESGAYRTRYYATVEALKEPDGQADKGGAFSPTTVVMKEQC
ncbi:hypothetical protein HET69_38970 [Streptomyces sp. CJ_13]|uniref:hypothetical protein n=1 Tax=Streptomyces sp. CJ_13 TaxID=2724943 RepID=UPI001BDD43E3|nr:hypothetical protein [Streptomyces sp. CJ_13]MBT1189806.1 hypothetical protein [Streptomyces sp. CJ_13]